MTARHDIPYLNSFTCVRGIAAWFVVFYHIRSATPWIPEPLHMAFAKGYLAVDFFFLLSGFVIYLSSHQSIAEEGKAAILPFLGRRLARIYPLYAVILFLTVIFAALLTALGRDTSGYPWSELPLHILLMQNWGFTPALSWNHPAWSISTEMAAYLLFPLLILGTPITRAGRPTLLAAMAGLLAIMGWWLSKAGLHNLGQYIVQYGIVRCLFEFATGALLCAFWLKDRGNNQRNALLGAFLIAALAGTFWAIIPKAELWAFPTMMAALLFLLAEYTHKRGIDDRPPSLPMRVLIYVGEISYATYLAHFMLFTWFKIALVHDSADIAPWKICLFLLATLLTSITLYHLVEKPGKTLLSSWFKRKVASHPRYPAPS